MIQDLALITVATAADSASATTMLQPSPEYAAGWGSLALINAGLAQGKNRSGLHWFLLSLLLGPIATFLLVACYEKLPEPRAAKPDRPVVGTDPAP